MKIIATACFALLSSLVLAADPAAVVASAAPFEGAVNSIADFTTINYLPGYGLNVNASWMGDYDLEENIETLKGVVTGLAPLVKGLESGDYVSVAMRAATFFGEADYVVVRLNTATGNLEVWVNGTLR